MVISVSFSRFLHIQDTLDSLGCGDNVEVKAVPKGDTGDATSVAAVVTAAASATDMATPKAGSWKSTRGKWGKCSGKSSINTISVGNHLKIIYKYYKCRKSPKNHL